MPESELGAIIQPANLPTSIHEKLYVKGTVKDPTIQTLALLRRPCDGPGDGRWTTTSKGQPRLDIRIAVSDRLRTSCVLACSREPP